MYSFPDGHNIENRTASQHPKRLAAFCAANLGHYLSPQA